MYNNGSMKFMQLPPTGG